MVGLFAAEAAVAIERVDILARLDELNTALAQQVEALRLSDQFKSDFVSSVSHELRTPLASILGYTDILVTGELGEMTADQAEFLDIIDQNARRLLTLINDLLTLSGLESGRMVIRPEPVDLRDLVRANVHIHAPAVVAHRQRLERDLPDEPVTAVVDSDRISQVLQPGLERDQVHAGRGRLGIALAVEGGRGRPGVSDSGIGISEDDRERLFERFFRAGNAVEQAIPGTGLGLAICKGIVDAHAGHLSLESTLGEGTTVTVRLPMTWRRDNWDWTSRCWTGAGSDSVVPPPGPGGRRGAAPQRVSCHRRWARPPRSPTRWRRSRRPGRVRGGRGLHRRRRGGVRDPRRRARWT